MQENAWSRTNKFSSDRFESFKRNHQTLLRIFSATPMKMNVKCEVTQQKLTHHLELTTFPSEFPF